MARSLRLILVACLAGGCTLGVEERASQDARLLEIEARLEALDASIAASRADLGALEASRADASRSVDAALGELSSSVAALPDTIAELCARPEPAPAPKCEPTEPVRTVVMQSDKLLVGELERVWVEPPGAVLVARMDTSATSSSVNADKLTRFERDGEDWIRFEISVNGEPSVIERRIVRYARVIQQADPEGSRRPVVQLRVRIGNVDETFEFTLADRSHLQNEVILGRNFLADITLVDVGRQFIQPVVEPTEQ